MKKIFIIILFIVSFFNLVFATEQQKSLWTWNTSWTWNNCSVYRKEFSITWLKNIKVWYLSSFKVKGIQDISWNIYRNKKKVFLNKWEIFSYSFKFPWEAKLQANFKYKSCDIKIIKNLYIYNKFIISLIEGKDISFISSLWYKKQYIYYKNYTLKEILLNKSVLNMSDYIMVDYNYITKLLSQLWDKINIYNTKKFVFLVPSPKWFFLRLIISYIKWLDKKNIYIYDKDRFLEVFTKIYQWKQLNQKNLLSLSNVWDRVYLPLSYFVNKLIENNFNIELLWIVLLVLFWTIIVAFFRQVIWFSVFWVYTPLLFSIILMTLKYKIALLLFIISVLSSLVTYFITKKIYILYSAKISLNYIIYVIFSIACIWFIVNYADFNLFIINSSFILPFFIMPLLTKNFIKEDTRIFSKTFLLFILEFIFIITILLAVLKLTLLKYILIAYPDILWMLTILVIFIGRFSGLQLLEYIRFYPLIKKNIQEEE